ncbi:tripartite tricarboxylate transporter TctB family protein [Futiania mangrovi]|uniref:Tripartite tricarboxylate transporter TctB family protein n=1 Tax=Futiania mangrovi TaxID=2959716 RepID=A0A9J6PA86_9PROT|nr:tripartite tricarboxylate transporter TctB family protein [Futiania mangrovii]MCP1336964.1 tripartite tricarboxylate transporter TctB family protein [Futiania mangrovii]
MKALNGEAMLAMAVLAACALFSFVIVPAGVDTSYVDPRDLGPRFILDIASAGMALAAGAALVRIGLGKAASGEAAPSQAEAPVPEPRAEAHADERRGRRRVLVVLAALGIYSFVLIDLIGFYVASVVTLGAVTWLLGERRVALVALYALVLTASIYVLFEMVLQSRLPKGWILQSLGVS